ncbi:MAG: hypothetical protein GF401_01395 [Chitinivibrionales bacterium]|nr:hypothetical protein [Chitinivibrionales bacterium]
MNKITIICLFQMFAFAYAEKACDTEALLLASSAPLNFSTSLAAQSDAAMPMGSPGQSHDAIEKGTRKGMALSITSLVAHTASAAVWGAGFLTNFPSYDTTEGVNNAKENLNILRLTGGTLMGLSVLPACLGAQKVRVAGEMNSLNAPITNLWPSYFTGCGLVIAGSLIGIGGGIIADQTESEAMFMVTNIGGLAVSLIGEFYWFRTTIDAIKYSKKVRRMLKTDELKLVLTPIIRTNGQMGLALTKKF